MNEKYRGIKIGIVLAMAGVVLVLAVGCGAGAPATPTPTATPPPTATPAPGTTWGAPTLAFDKMQVDLGTVTQGQVGLQTFLVMNRGDGPLQVGPVDVQVEQGSTNVATKDGVLRLQMGEMALLPITFGPHQELGPHLLRVNVPSNDPVNPMATLSVRFDVTEEPPAAGAGPRLGVDREIIDIGTVPTDWPLYERFTLRNDGDAPLMLEGVPVVRVEDGC